MTYQVRLAPSARRGLNRLPEAVAAAAIEMVTGPLAESPHRVGKPLLAPLAGKHSARRGQYRVVYEIDDAALVVTVISITHRRDSYRVGG